MLVILYDQHTHCKFLAFYLLGRDGDAVAELEDAIKRSPRIAKMLARPLG
jgi:hypothetical protein